MADGITLADTDRTGNDGLPPPNSVPPPERFPPPSSLPPPGYFNSGAQGPNRQPTPPVTYPSISDDRAQAIAKAGLPPPTSAPPPKDGSINFDTTSKQYVGTDDSIKFDTTSQQYVGTSPVNAPLGPTAPALGPPPPAPGPAPTAEQLADLPQGATPSPQTYSPPVQAAAPVNAPPPAPGPVPSAVPAPTPAPTPQPTAATQPATPPANKVSPFNPQDKSSAAAGPVSPAAGPVSPFNPQDKPGEAPSLTLASGQGQVSPFNPQDKPTPVNLTGLSSSQIEAKINGGEVTREDALKPYYNALISESKTAQPNFQQQAQDITDFAQGFLTGVTHIPQGITGLATGFTKTFQTLADAVGSRNLEGMKQYEQQQLQSGKIDQPTYDSRMALLNQASSISNNLSSSLPLGTGWELGMGNKDVQPFVQGEEQIRALMTKADPDYVKYRQAQAIQEALAGGEVGAGDLYNFYKTAVDWTNPANLPNALTSLNTGLTHRMLVAQLGGEQGLLRDMQSDMTPEINNLKKGNYDPDTERLLNDTSAFFGGGHLPGQEEMEAHGMGNNPEAVSDIANTTFLAATAGLPLDEVISPFASGGLKLASGTLEGISKGSSATATRLWSGIKNYGMWDLMLESPKLMTDEGRAELATKFGVAAGGAAVAKGISIGSGYAADVLKSAATGIYGGSDFFTQFLGRSTRAGVDALGNAVPFAIGTSGGSPAAFGQALGQMAPLHMALKTPQIIGGSIAGPNDALFISDPRNPNSPVPDKPYRIDPQLDQDSAIEAQKLDRAQLGTYTRVKQLMSGRAVIYLVDDAGMAAAQQRYAGANGSTFSAPRGFAAPGNLTSHGLPEVYINTRNFNDAFFHEAMGHPAYWMLNPAQRSQLVALVKRVNDPVGFTNNYFKNTSFAGTDYNSLPTDAEVISGARQPGPGGFTKGKLDEEMAAEQLGAIFSGGTLDKWSKDPNLSRRMRMFVGAALEKMGVPSTTAESTTTLGVQPSVTSAAMFDKNLRDWLQGKTQQQAPPNQQPPPNQPPPNVPPNQQAPPPPPPPPNQPPPNQPPPNQQGPQPQVQQPVVQQQPNVLPQTQAQPQVQPVVQQPVTGQPSVQPQPQTQTQPEQGQEQKPVAEQPAEQPAQQPAQEQPPIGQPPPGHEELQPLQPVQQPAQDVHERIEQLVKQGHNIAHAKAIAEGREPETPPPTPSYMPGAEGVANFFKKRGDKPITDPNDPRLTDVKVGDSDWRVNKEAAPAFQGFLSELASKGAPVKALEANEGWNYRPIAGTKNLSEHAYGGAIDVNQTGRNQVTPEFRQWLAANPNALKEAENHWHIYGGERFGDLGHFEWGGVPIKEGQAPTAAAEPSAEHASYNPISGMHTIFGLNYDRSIDRSDNGRGFFGYNTRDPKTKVVAVPGDVLNATFGNFLQEHPDGSYTLINTPEAHKIFDEVRSAHVEVPDEQGNKHEFAIGDVQGALAKHPGHVLDFSYGAAKEMGYGDNGPVNYQIVAGDGSPYKTPDVSYMPEIGGGGGDGELATPAGTPPPAFTGPPAAPAPTVYGSTAMPQAPGQQEQEAPAQPPPAPGAPPQPDTGPYGYGYYPPQMQYGGRAAPEEAPPAPVGLAGAAAGGPSSVSFMPSMGGITPEGEEGLPPSTLGIKQPKSFGSILGSLTQGNLKQALADHAAALSDDDTRVKKQDDGFFKGEHFLPGDPLHNRVLSNVPTNEQHMMNAAQSAIANKMAMHGIYESAPKMGLQDYEAPTTKSRAVEYEMSTPQARLLKQGNAQQAGHSWIPVSVGVKTDIKKNQPYEGYVQGISANTLANNWHHINKGIGEAGLGPSPYPQMNLKFHHDVEGYIHNLNMGWRGTGDRLQEGTEQFPAPTQAGDIPYPLKPEETHFLNLLFNNRRAFAKSAGAERELAQAGGTLLTPAGETNPLRHALDEHYRPIRAALAAHPKNAGNAAVQKAAKKTWSEDVLEPTIKTFKAGLIHSLHASPEDIPEGIRPGNEFKRITESMQRNTPMGRPDIPMAVSFMPGEKAEKPKRPAIKPLSPEEHEELAGNIRKQWLSGKLRTSEYRDRMGEVPGPGEAIEEPEKRDVSYMPMAGPQAKGFMKAKKEGRTFTSPLQPEGPLRFEISDRDLNFKPAPEGSVYRNKLEDYTKKNWEAMPLASAISHPELFKNYPSLRQVKLRHDDTIDSDAYYEHPWMTSQGKSRGNEIVLKDPTDKQSLAHEIQHAVQYQEGFPRGTSPEETQYDLSQSQPVMDELRKNADSHEELSEGEKKQWMQKRLASMAYARYMRTPGEIEARVVGGRAIAHGMLREGERMTSPDLALLRERRRTEDRYPTPPEAPSGVSFMPPKAAAKAEKLTKPTDWKTDADEATRQAYLEKRVANTIAGQQKHESAIPLKVQRKEGGGVQYDQNLNPVWEKTDYNLADMPMLQKKGKGLTNLVDGDKHEDTLDEGEHKHLNKTERRRLSALRAQNAIKTLGDRIVKSYNSIKDIPEIAAGKGWYSSMRDKMAKAFGAGEGGKASQDHELFAQLLGATSAKTPVRDNFIQALDAFEQMKAGKEGQTEEQWLQGLKDGSNHHLGFNRHIAKYQEAYEKMKEGKGALAEYMRSKGMKLTEPKGGVTDASAMADWIDQHGIRPLQKSGSKYNANSDQVLKVLAGTWLDEVGAPKTPNFAGNLTGRTLAATIDVWAARHLHRLGHEGEEGAWRPQSAAEPGVNSLDFAYAQDAMKHAADKLGIAPDDLQAILWYAEKHHYEKHGWTGAAGANKGSFDETWDRAFPKEGPHMTSAELRGHYQAEKAKADKLKHLRGMVAEKRGRGDTEAQIEKYLKKWADPFLEKHGFTRGHLEGPPEAPGGEEDEDEEAA